MGATFDELAADNATMSLTGPICCCMHSSYLLLRALFIPAAACTLHARCYMHSSHPLLHALLALHNTTQSSHQLIPLVPTHLTPCSLVPHRCTTATPLTPATHARYLCIPCTLVLAHPPIPRRVLPLGEGPQAHLNAPPHGPTQTPLPGCCCPTALLSSDCPQLRLLRWFP